MKRLLFLAGTIIFAGLSFGQNTNPAPRPLIDQYCVTCHNQRAKTAGLMLDKMDPAYVAQDREAWEKVVRKHRAGMMPPQGMPRPNDATYEALTVALENELDRAAAQKPKLSTPGMHRLNRTEYANAIRELVGLDIDPAGYLPADDSSYGFDNVESGLQVSPALVEGYVSAAAKLSRLALGHETAPGRKIYYTREDYSQEDQVEGLPFGTRGGLLVRHYFPSDGEYIISWVPVRNTVGALYGGDSENEQIDLSVTFQYSEDETLELVKLLLDFGAGINSANEDGLTALHGAAYKGANKVVELLVSRGADLTARDKGKDYGFGVTSFRMTPLNWAEGVPIGMSSAIRHDETVKLIARLMEERGIPVEYHGTFTGRKFTDAPIIEEPR